MSAINSNSQRVLETISIEEGYFSVGDTITYDVVVDHEVKPGRKRRPPQRHTGLISELWAQHDTDRTRYYAEVVDTDGSEHRVWFWRDKAEFFRSPDTEPIADPEPVKPTLTKRDFRFGQLEAARDSIEALTEGFEGRVIAHRLLEANRGENPGDDYVLNYLHLMEVGIHRLRAEYVATMRANGASWAQVGDLLGITKQAAQQRFGGAK